MRNRLFATAIPLVVVALVMVEVRVRHSEHAALMDCIVGITLVALGVAVLRQSWRSVKAP